MFLINIRTIKHMGGNRLWKGNRQYTWNFESPSSDGVPFSRLLLIRDYEGYTCNMSSSHGLDDDFQYDWDIEEQLRRNNYIKARIRIAEKLGLWS